MSLLRFSKLGRRVAQGNHQLEFQNFFSNSRQATLGSRWMRINKLSTSNLNQEFSGVSLTERGAEQLRTLQTRSNKDGLKLRLSVEGGGCSGFQYKFETTEEDPRSDDLIFQNNGQTLLVDEVSFDFVKGAKVDFTEDLIRRSFEVVDNPNAEAGCGCGASFAAKEMPGDSPF